MATTTRKDMLNELGLLENFMFTIDVNYLGREEVLSVLKAQGVPESICNDFMKQKSINQIGIKHLLMLIDMAKEEGTITLKSLLESASAMASSFNQSSS